MSSFTKPIPRHSRRRRAPRSAWAIALLVLGIGLLPLGLGAAVLQSKERAHQRAALDRALTGEVTAQVSALHEYFERARSVVLVTAQNPAFRDFYSLPGTRAERIRADGPVVRRAGDALAYLQRLYPTSIGEANFIDRSGAENARVTRGRWARPSELSPDESRNAFFALTFALAPGQVYEARPYVSQGTGEWVVSNSTLVPTGDGSKRAIAHFEVTVESFRKEAARNAHELLFVDATTGQVIVDSRFPQRKGVPLGRPRDKRFVTLMQHGLPSGVVELNGVRASYRRVARNSGNVNDWYVVALARPARVSTLRGHLTLFGLLGSILLLVSVVMGRRWARINREFSLLRRRSADELRASEARYKEAGEWLRAVIDASPLAIVALDSNGLVTMWNGSAERMFGWSEEEVLGRESPVVGDDGVISRVLQGESFTGLELGCQKRDGSLVQVSLSAAPLFNGARDPVGAVAVLEDAMRRKRVEEQLR